MGHCCFAGLAAITRPDHYSAVKQWFPTGGTRTPRGTQAHCRGYVETFNNHLCYVILFENHQHGGTHGMTNRLRGYTRQKRLGNTAVKFREKGLVFFCFSEHGKGQPYCVPFHAIEVGIQVQISINCLPLFCEVTFVNSLTLYFLLATVS